MQTAAKQKPAEIISLPRTRQTECISSYSKKVVNRLSGEVSNSFSINAISGYQNQIRSYEKEEQIQQLMIELPTIARDYGALKVISDSTYKECIDLVRAKFSFMGVCEIREAYRQFAIQETKAQGGEMFYGEFNAFNLGRILSAYNLKRKKIIAEYIRSTQEDKEKSKAVTYVLSKKEQFERNFSNMIEQGKQSIDHWDKVPAYWYSACIKRNYIDMSKIDAHKIFEKAGQLLLTAKESDNTFDVKAIFTHKIDAEERQKVIARKLVVFIYVLNKELEI